MPTARARTVPLALRGVVTSTVARVLPKLSPPTVTLPVSVLLSACLRIRLTEAEGLPVPVSRPAAPRTISTRWYSAVSIEASL